MTRKTKTATARAPAAHGRESYVIQLAGQPYTVPPLPILCNREAYPACNRVSNSDMIKTFVETGELNFTSEDIDDLALVAFLGVSAGDPEFTREAFDALPIAPMELIDAFFIVRLATGGWVRAPAPAA